MEKGFFSCGGVELKFSEGKFLGERKAIELVTNCWLALETVRCQFNGGGRLEIGKRSKFGI